MKFIIRDQDVKNPMRVASLDVSLDGHLNLRIDGQIVAWISPDGEIAARGDEGIGIRVK